jgi:hypothetical protein
VPEVFEELRRRRESIGSSRIVFCPVPAIVRLWPFHVPTAGSFDRVRIVEAHIRLAPFRTEHERVTDAVRSCFGFLRSLDDKLDNITLGGLS